MIQIGNLWLLLGTILPALLGSTATYPETGPNKYTFSALLGLSALVFSTIEIHKSLLNQVVRFGNYELPILQLLFVHFGILIAICWVFQMVANRLENTLGKIVSFFLFNSIGIAVVANALLLPNYVNLPQPP